MNMKKASLSAVAAGAAVVLFATGCVQSQRGEGGGASGDVNATFTFAASSDPLGLDPAFAQDGETFRVARQIFEGLIGVKPGSADPAPLLAESWETSDDNLSYTFKLKEGVTFHDGTDFNADAVCANFDRWYNWEGLPATLSFSYYYNSIFGGGKDAENPLFESCEAVSDSEVTVNLTRPFSGFIASLSLPAFSMQSPAAMEEFGADAVGGSEEAPEYSEYAQGHPVGTGPFTFTSWAPGESVVLNANEDYWGEQGQVQEIVFRIIDDPTARRQALEAGEVDGYDLVSPADTEALAADGFNVMQRDPFTILYLGFNQEIPELKDVRVRQAISHAINKDALAQQVLPEGTEVATQFIPESVNGHNPDVTTYDYDPDRAKALLAEAGYADGLTVEFNYPVNISRPYMPLPEQIFSAISADLEEVGIKVNPVTDEWGEYIDRTNNTSNHGIHLLGWTGDYNNTDNFVGVFFGKNKPEFGFTNQEIFDALAQARELPEQEATSAYQDINELIALEIPAVPLAHPAPSLAFSERVTSYPASPVLDEVYNEITLSE